MPKTKSTLALKNELAVIELIKKFRHEHTWLEAVPSKPQWVGNDVIKIPIQGNAPKVLIDNTIYPINSSQREDGHLKVSLHKYETENTEVTTDELYALPYEKVNDVQTQHRETLEDVTAEHALFSITPQNNTATTPVLTTTGEDDGTGRKRLITKDLRRMKKALDKLGVPKKGRVLVLCSDHVDDLLEQDETFNTRYQNHTEGKIAEKYYGFKVYESTYAPEFTAAGEKIAYDSQTSGYEASVVFFAPMTAKAPGTAERYAIEKSQNPSMRRHEIGFELHWVCVAMKDEGLGAIRSVAV
ncbi:MAG: phage capsid protein [Bergeyella sp.]